LNIHDPDLTVELMLGYLFYPIAFLLGVQREDVLGVSQLIGVKVVANEFVAVSFHFPSPFTSLSRFLTSTLPSS
jgi:nucleoside permease NupC